MMSTATTITLAQLLDELDGYRDRVPLDRLSGLLRSLDVDESHIAPFVRFAPDTYRRNLVRAGHAYHALVLCWRPGQRSPIHDHRGSSCAVRVLGGTCTETIFDRTPAGHVFPTRTHELPAGACCGSADADIHQISNLSSDGQDLITLHVYSPPLLLMGQYSLTSATRTEFADRDFVEGDGI